MKISSESIEKNYETYVLGRIEKMMIMILSGGMCGGIGYIFYRRFIFSVIFSFAGSFGPKLYKKYKIAKQKREILHQFLASLFSFRASVSAGESIENSLKSIIDDMVVQFSEEAYIVREYRLIMKKINYNSDFYTAFQSFAARTGDIDIINFSVILKLTQSTGGNMSKIIKRTSRVIGEKIALEREIKVLLEARKFELKILIALPLAIIFLLTESAKSYMAPIYNTILGNVMTSIALIFISTGIFLSYKILRIEEMND